MFKNYFYLSRLAKELDTIISGSTIREAFTQDKDKLFLSIPCDEFPYRHLIISTDPNIPFITIKPEHRKAKKNTVDFFTDYFPAKVDSVKICTDDRILKFELFNGELFFYLRGNNTNVLFSNNETFEVFKKNKKTNISAIREEVIGKQFIPEYITDFKYLDSSEKFEEQLKIFYPFVSKDIIREVKIRKSSDDLKHIKDLLAKISSEIICENIVVLFDSENGKPIFAPVTFYPCADVSNIYSSYLDAINARLKIKYQTEPKLFLQKDIAATLGKQINYLTVKLEKLKNRIDQGCRDEEYKHIGNLLLGNISSITKGQKAIEVLDYATGGKILIKLDEKLSPQKNIDKYFEKSKDEKINFVKSKELYEAAKKQFDELLLVKNEFENSEETSELRSVANHLKIEKKLSGSSKKLETQYKFKQYLIANKYSVFVGKDSKSNDYLSVKFAKQNDYWFHARGLPGSHVVLRVENTKEVVPKNILKSAASIAAFHSKAKTAGTAPVSYTFAKFVYKKKGMEPGKVMIQKEKVLLVKPEIPSDTEFIEE